MATTVGAAIFGYAIAEVLTLTYWLPTWRGFEVLIIVGVALIAALSALAIWVGRP